MTDIAKLLRERVALDDFPESLIEGHEEAMLEEADEIETLRQLLSECVPHLERGQPILWKRVRETIRRG